MSKYSKKSKNSEIEPKTSQSSNSGGKEDNKIITIILAVIAVLLLIQTVQKYNESRSTVPITRPEVTQNQPLQQQQDMNINQQIQPDMQQQQPQTAGPTTEVTYSTMSHDFGTVAANETKRHTFRLANTGDTDLQYTNVYGDQGVNVLSWPTQPIPPGGSGEIDIEFNPQGESGPVNKIIHLDANTNPGHVHINVTANVQ
ncbi:MAG: DUF1573 domain-containing protein [Chitinophagaceae bacterium]|nr:MAG: DUF1573 domain-containing protein [Chitinophagaceae bacterium]